MRRILLIVSFIVGCAETRVAVPPVRSSPPSTKPTASSAPVPTPAAPTAEEQALRIVPPAPPECSGYRRHGVDGVDGAASCAERAQGLAALDQALAETDATARDAALARLGGCVALQPGLVQALRAEFAPAACGDLLVADFPDVNRSRLAPAMYDALTGLGLAAQLTRLVRVAPQLDKPYTKERIDAFVRGVMANWATQQANAISALSFKGSRLSGYGKGIVALEAGLADMRFVEVFRRVPIPEEFEQDPELTDAYYSALDQGLEPRKARGRDAALVGLRVFSELGAITDARVDLARRLLSELYNGRRINALDGLLLAPMEHQQPWDEAHRLAATLPTFYVDFVLGVVEPSSTSLLWALLHRGMPASVLNRLERSVLSAENQQVYARALFERGRTYWRNADFAAVVTLTTNREPATDSGRLVAALAHALEKSPNDAAAMILGSTQLMELGNLEPLERLAQGKSSVAPLADYDAAVIKELGSAGDSNAAFFRDLAARYARAARRLKDPAQKNLARERAAAAVDTANKLH